MEELTVPKLILPPETAAPNETGLFCIDMDGTIVDGHTHNIIWNAAQRTPAILQDPEAQWGLVKHLRPIGGGDPAAWRKLFHTLIQDGHSIAITSFSSFGKYIIKRYLNEVIGLDEDFIEKHIRVVSSLPKDQSTKQPHILRAQKKTGRTNLLPEKIILCDDRFELVWDAIHKKYIGIFATKDGAHIQALLEKSKTLKLPKESNQENKSTPYSSRTVSPHEESSSGDSLHISPFQDKVPSPYISPRETSTSNPALAAFLDADAKNPLSPSPKIFSAAEQLLRNSPTRAATRRSSSSECSLQSSGEYNNDALRSSLDRLRIIH